MDCKTREVRLERWDRPRAFHVVPCTFRVDVPLDMSGCIVSALRATMSRGLRRVPGGQILASDARRSGAVFVEVESPDEEDSTLAWLEGDLLSRALPSEGARIRTDVDELMRWALMLGHDVDSFYVGFVAAEGPRAFRPTRLLAALDGGIVEHFEVRGSRQYFVRVAG